MYTILTNIKDKKSFAPFLKIYGIAANAANLFVAMVTGKCKCVRRNNCKRKQNYFPNFQRTKKCTFLDEGS